MSLSVNPAEVAEAVVALGDPTPYYNEPISAFIPLTDVDALTDAVSTASTNEEMRGLRFGRIRTVIAADMADKAGILVELSCLRSMIESGKTIFDLSIATMGRLDRIGLRTLFMDLRLEFSYSSRMREPEKTTSYPEPRWMLNRGLSSKSADKFGY